MGLTKFKLTPAGEAYLKAANDKDQPHKGVIIHKTGLIDIRTITDNQAEHLVKSKSAYVEEKKGT